MDLKCNCPSFCEERDESKDESRVCGGKGEGVGGAWHKLVYLRCHIILLYQLVPPCLYNPPRWEQTSRVATVSLTPITTKQTILKSFNPNKEYSYKIQLNIFKTSKVGIEESGRYREV